MTKTEKQIYYLFSEIPLQITEKSCGTIVIAITESNALPVIQKIIKLTNKPKTK